MKRNRLTAVLAVAVGTLGLPAAAQASAYSDGVLASNPLTYLRLGETTGTIAQDASPNNRDGAYADDFTLGAAGPFTDAGTSVKLAKTGAITANVPATSGSVELWVNPDRMVKNPQAPLVAHGNPATDGWALGVGNRRKLVWKGGGGDVATKVSLGSGVWTALTVTWDGSKVRFYRNGALAKTFNGAVTPSSSGGAVAIAGDGNGGFGGSFSGRMDEVALYSQVLSASDVAGHFGHARVPVNTALPSVGGAAGVGQTLTANAGTWTGAGDPAVYPRSYQWQRCDDGGEDDICAEVPGATGPTHLLADGDQCSTFRVVETVRNAYGAASAVSEPSGVVEACDPDTQDPAPINDALPVIDGTAVVGATLTVQTGAWSFAEGSPTYQWQLCDGSDCADIADATGTTYLVAAGDACKTVQVVETMTNATGSDSVTSEQTMVVVPCGDTGGDPGDGTGTGGGGGNGTGTSTGTGTGTGTGAGAAGGPGVQPAACLKLLPGRRQVKVRGLGTLRLKAAAGACVTKALPALFKARKGVKVKSVRYKLDGKRLAGVKRPRFGARLKASKLRAGKHTLTVRVTPRAGKAKAAKLRMRVVVA